MAALTFVDLIVKALLGAVATPLFWGIIALVVFAVAMMLGRVRVGGSMHLGLILVFGLSDAIGGSFTIISAGLAALSGAVLMAGIIKRLRQRG